MLGCTHYPLLHDVIDDVMGHEVKLVDSAESVAADARDRLHDDTSLTGEEGSHADGHHFFVTDEPEPFQLVAERFPGACDPSNLERARIEGE